jgi:hypothetical protein
MKRQTRFTPQEQQQALEQQQAAQQRQGQTSPLEFETPEELLRHDAAQTLVPPGIERRLQDSLGRAPAAPRAWWRRLLGLG